MKTGDFTRDPRVERSVKRLKSHWQREQKEVSDILDARGHQYVDLVMEGGGVLGIALVGYTYALESVGIRFLGVGGTSAGAINALGLAALGKPSQAKSLKLLKVLADLEMFSFVDGDGDARDFVKAFVGNAGTTKLIWQGMQVIDNLNDHLGLNPGNAFSSWLSEVIGRVGIRTLADLEARMTPSELRRRDGRPFPEREWGSRLAVVAADISTETKVVLPEMASLYWRRPRSENPAQFVRASMSIPGFFHPFRVSGIPRGSRAEARWEKYAGYTGETPDAVLFVDGGIMSNFPIDLFHAQEVPLAPTLGAKLGVSRTKPREITGARQLIAAVFDAARHVADYDFLIKHPDYRHLITFIQTGEHDWLEFDLGPDAKIDLFSRGVEAATGFLIGFDWPAYKAVRRARGTGC